VGPRILVRKCFRDHIKDENGDVLLYRTELASDTTNWFEIIAVSPQCRYFRQEHIGNYLHCPEWTAGFNRVGDSEWALHEKLLDNGMLKGIMYQGDGK